MYMYMYTLVNYGIHGPCVACAELYTRQSYFVHIHHVAHKHQAYDCELGKGEILLFHWTSNRSLHLMSLHYATYYKNVLVHEDNTLLAYTA